MIASPYPHDAGASSSYFRLSLDEKTDLGYHPARSRPSPSRHRNREALPLPIVVPRLAALWLLGLLGPAPAADLPAAAEVVIGSLDVFDEPDPTSYAPRRLRRGDRVVVCDIEPDGWLAIDPPDGSFCWVEASALGEPDENQRARVRAARTALRSGHPDARMPGAPRATLERGDVVRLLDRPPLRLGQGSAARTWRAVAPPSGEVRHVRADGVRWLADRSEPMSDPESPPTATYCETQAAFLPPMTVTAGPLPPAIAAELAPIEAEHRAIVRGPVAQWHLETVRQRYEAVLRHVTDTATGNAIRARLDLIARQEDAAQAARTIATILDRSRRRDRLVAQEIRRLAQARTPQARPFDAQGLMQPSSQRVEGRKVFALIGPEGTAAAYLDIPAGLDSGPFVARRVGVRGTVHYSEPLRARLIAVREIEPLDKTQKKQATEGID
jgi:hypothetical protein